MKSLFLLSSIALLLLAFSPLPAISMTELNTHKIAPKGKPLGGSGMPKGQGPYAPVRGL